MDYKTNQLPKGIEAKDELMSEYPELKFAVLGENQILFDYTRYLEEAKLPNVDYKVFMRLCKKWIETLAKSHNISTSELFFLNKDGHILVASQLVIPFLMFVNDDAFIYFNNLIIDALQQGVAYSNGFMYNMALDRMPVNILQEIIKNKENGDKEE